MTKEEKLKFLRSAGPHLEGKKVNYTIHGIEGSGKLSFYRENLYICQNSRNGCPCANTHGFLYSYQAISANTSCWDISFVDEYKYGDKVYSKSHGKCTYLCVVPSGSVYDPGHLIMTARGYIFSTNDLNAPEETVRLNDSYNAVINSDGITVGCQKFDFSALDSLVKAAGKFRK